MADPKKKKTEPERTVCRACGTIDVARRITLDGTPLLVCPKCGTLRVASIPRE